MKDIEKHGALLVVIAGICWGVIGIFTRQLSAASVSPLQITWIRSSLTAIGMAICIFLTDKRRFYIKLTDIWMFIGTGIFSIVLFNICYFKSIEMTTMSVAAVLLYTAPAMVVIMSTVLFHERLTIQKITALIMALSGCVLITGIIGSNAVISPAGIIVGLGAGFGYALYSIFGNFALKKYHPFTVTFYTFLFACLALMPFAKIASLFSAVSGYKCAALYCAGMAIVSTLIPFLCYTQGLRYLEAGKASVMAFIEPFVATLCGVAVFKEKITAQSLIGMSLIFISVVLLNLKFTERRDCNE